MTQVFCVSICLYHRNNFPICLIYKKWVRPNTFLRDAGHFNRWLFNPKPRFFNHEVGVECPHRITRLLTRHFNRKLFKPTLQPSFPKKISWLKSSWLNSTGLKLWVKKYGAETLDWKIPGLKCPATFFQGWKDSGHYTKMYLSDPQLRHLHLEHFWQFLDLFQIQNDQLLWWYSLLWLLDFWLPCQWM